MLSNELNFVHPSISDKDVELFGFNDIDNVSIQEHWLMAHIMVEAGLFSSVSNARKNGWNIPIPKGFWQKKVGKRKVLISILNELVD
tara:strand:+ start:328 stop:588 length:261 start_codon:yes stop_codon:yes gene_type:complete